MNTKEQKTLSSHYSFAMKPKQMRQWSNKQAIHLCEVLRQRNTKNTFPVLVYTGMSGVSHAAYLSAALNRRGLEFGQIYVRKEGERSHTTRNGYEISDNAESNEKDITLVFIDDFVCSGKTLKTCVKAATKAKTMCIRYLICVINPAESWRVKSNKEYTKLTTWQKAVAKGWV